MKKWQWLAVGLCLVATACSSGKQEAVLAMDEARLNIAAAEKAGAGIWANYSLAQAKKQLSDAVKRFEAKEFGYARVSAQQAASQAISAAAEAKDKAAQSAARSAKKAPTKKKKS